MFPVGRSSINHHLVTAKHISGWPTSRDLDTISESFGEPSGAVSKKSTVEEMAEASVDPDVKRKHNEQSPTSRMSRRQSDREPFEFDICLSYAGEDRAYVDRVADGLRSRGVRVFYDAYEKATLWGKDLYQHLAHVYQDAAKYCVVFVSDHYSQKLWTKHECQSAQARAFEENTEYILPARFDDTEIPGLRQTIAYIDLRTTEPPELVDLICKKLCDQPPAREMSADGQVALARELAAHAVATRNEVASANENNLNWADLLKNPDRKFLLERSALLAIESLRRGCTEEGERALRDALAWLPWPAFTLSHHAGEAAFTPDGKYIVSAGWKEARVWETATQCEIRRIDLLQDPSVSAVRLSHDGRLLAVFGGNSVTVWQIHTGERVATLPHPPHNDKPVALFSPDDRFLATATRWEDHAVQLWAIPSGRQVAELTHASRVRLAAFSPNGMHILTVSGADGTDEEKTAWVWSVPSGQQTRRLDHREFVCAAAFSPDGKHLVTTDRTLLRTWDASTFAPISEVQVQEGIYDLQFSPDSRHVLVGSWYNRGAALLEAGTWRVLWTAAEGSVMAGVFAPGTKYVALKHLAIDTDKSCRVWNVDTGREVARLPLEWWRDVSGFSPGGEYILTPGGSSGPVKLWPLIVGDPVATTCERLTRNLTPDEWHRYFGREPYRRTCAKLP